MKNPESHIPAAENGKSMEERMKDKVWRRVRGLQLTADERVRLDKELVDDERLVREVAHGQRMAHNAISLAESIEAIHLHALGGETRHASVQILNRQLTNARLDFEDIKISIPEDQREAFRAICGDLEKIIKAVGNIELCLDRRDLARAVGILVTVQKTITEGMINAGIRAERAGRLHHLINPLINGKDGLFQKLNKRLEEIKERIQDGVYLATK